MYSHTLTPSAFIIVTTSTEAAGDNPPALQSSCILASLHLAHIQDIQTLAVSWRLDRTINISPPRPCTWARSRSSGPAWPWSRPSPCPPPLNRTDLLTTRSKYSAIIFCFIDFSIGILHYLINSSIFNYLS